MKAIYYRLLKYDICCIGVYWVEDPISSVISIQLLRNNKTDNDELSSYNISTEIKYFIDKGYDIYNCEEKHSSFIKSLINSLDNYFINSQPINFSIDNLFFKPFGQFQINVLKTLYTIPFGSTISYKELALKSGYCNAFRAVGTTMNKNPFPIIIPCHRVIKSDMSIGGFAIGSDVKKMLLAHEKIKINK